MVSKVTSETYFFKYAFPCTQVLLDQGKIDQATFQKLKLMHDTHQIPDRKTLENTYKSAFRRLKMIAKRKDKDYWDIEVIKKYFLEDHNIFINLGEGDYANFPTELKELCKVYVAEIVDKNGDILTVRYPNTQTQSKVVGKELPEAKVGDKVTIHLGFAVEIL
ncbi:HypC/HybG/HupF family hydrogenase formation chaperone [Candidatus Woesearchaeota archaeon]|nr:HypC/HybG/HupF family hydrogenase formation chaperone [Candidatus Woesearchaeota archaeon]